MIRTLLGSSLRQGGPPIALTAIFVAAVLHLGLTRTISATVGILLGLLLFAGIVAVWRYISFRLRQSLGSRNSNALIAGPHVTLGVSTGTLAALGHTTGAKANTRVILGARELAMSVIVLGEVGSGKTSGTINPAADQLMKTGASFVYIDGKGDMARAIEALAHRNGRVTKRIGVGASRMNVLHGFSPQQIAKITKDAMRQNGMTGADSAFWINGAASVAESALTVLGEGDNYNLDALRRFVFNKAFYKERIAAASERLIVLQGRADQGDTVATTEKRALKMALEYFGDQYDTMHDPMRNGIQATLATVLQPFQSPALVDAFCSGDSDINLSDLDDGTIFVVELSFSEHDIAGPLVVLFLKERVFRHIRGRALFARDDRRRTLLTGVIADEYQKIVSLTDTESLEVIRSLGGFVIAGTQSINAMIRSLGSRETTYALLQNFVQKITYGTSDAETIDYFTKIIGEVEVRRESTSTTQSDHQVSYGTSEQLQRMSALTGQTFRGLVQDERYALAIALLKIRGQAYDDVIRVTKHYVEDLLPSEVGSPA